MIFESAWGIFESVLIEKLSFFSWLWCLLHQKQHLGGNNFLIGNYFDMAKVKFPLPQVNDTVLGSFSSNWPYVCWLQIFLIKHQWKQEMRSFWVKGFFKMSNAIEK